MASNKLSHYKQILQDYVKPDDVNWRYHLPDLPKARICNAAGLIKSIEIISNAHCQKIELKLIRLPGNRAIANDPLNNFIHLSLGDFHLQEYKDGILMPVTRKESTEYLIRFLKSGVDLNSVHYSFYGQSNSQLKSRSCFLLAGSKEEVSDKIENLGDFSKITSVAKKVKRIGLLFSTANVVLDVPAERCEDIPDIENKDFNFTDGCGLVSDHFARLLAQKRPIVFRNVRYRPSVFQIRYRGYKGVVTLEPTMEKQTWLQLRKSMRKFVGTSDLSFAVVDYSKPYTSGYLNDEIVLLLHALGIEDSVFIQKQRVYFQRLEAAQQNPIAAFSYLTSINQLDLAEKMLMLGVESVEENIKRIVAQERHRMINKREEQRCRILLPQSRLLFGICDPRNILKPGECFVRVTYDDGKPRTIMGAEVLVTRNPCLHPGDLRKLKAVNYPELSHLVDCIVFSTQGLRPAADSMSGGDLDGDTFFVCWDRDLIPERMSEPAQYPGGKEVLNFKPITDDDRIEYFAKYSSASLGRVKKLYLAWARHNGALSNQCQQLNRLFSLCVDGNLVKIPQNLEDPPAASSSKPFILDTLHDEAGKWAESAAKISPGHSCVSIDTMEELLCGATSMSAFERSKLALTWCQRNHADFTCLLKFLDLNQLTSQERVWLLNEAAPTKLTPSKVMNGLLHSSILTQPELAQYRLDFPGLRWKCVFDTSEDRLGNLLEICQRVFEVYHRKLLVFQISDRLSVAIYIPKIIEHEEECVVDTSVRLFAFPHSHQSIAGHRRVVPTKKSYRLYCDRTTFQLYESKRSNTFVFLTRSANNDLSYKGVNGTGNRRRARQETIDKGVNAEWRVSIALQKFSSALQSHVGRVNRNEVVAAEVYVISNTDVSSMRTLDLWLESVDTMEVHPLFETTPADYTISKLTDIDWEKQPQFIRRVARDRDFNALKEDAALTNMGLLLRFLHENNGSDLASAVFDSILSFPGSDTSADVYRPEIIDDMVSFLPMIPGLTIYFSRLCPWNKLPNFLCKLLVSRAPKLLTSLILSANYMEELVLIPVYNILLELNSLSLPAFKELVRNIALAVNSPSLTLDLFLECLGPVANTLLPGTPMAISYFVRSLFGITLEHCDEANEGSTPGKQLWSLEIIDSNKNSPLLKSYKRIDAPMMERLAPGDHVRLTVASDPTNIFLSRRPSIDALVESSEPTLVTFRCLHFPPPYIERCSWMLMYCGPFANAEAMSSALLNLIMSKQEVCGVYNHLLISEGNSNVSNARPIQYHYQPDLNESQNCAVSTSLNNSLTCLWGPPGTGKTHTIVTLLQALISEAPEERILVTAPTHNAVDNVLRQYVKRTKTGLRRPPLRVSTDVKRVADDLRNYTCDAMEGKDLNRFPAARRAAMERVKVSQLVFTTCIGAGLGLLRTETFSTVIIDEASQQTEPAALVPIVKGCQRLVLVGDHVQLRPTVRQHSQLFGFDVSMFERLYVSEENKFVHKVMLNTQYRMAPEICSFPSDEFYQGKLNTSPSCGTLQPASTAFPWPKSENGAVHRCVFIQCSTAEDLGRKSKSNAGQAKMCQEIYRQLITTVPAEKQKDTSYSVPAQSIAILTPYRSQYDHLTRLCSGAVISSIDGFQGREADIIIYVTVRSNQYGDIGFLKDMRRLNVALTRAKAGLIIIGDKETLTVGNGEAENEESVSVWRRLLDGLAVAELDMEGK